MKSSESHPTLTSFPDSSFYSDSIQEAPEYDLPALNLGAESPWISSMTPVSANGAPRTLDDEWAKLRAALQNHVPGRTTSWRSDSFSRRNRSWVDGDCGICFEAAIAPCRTLCCGKVFCQEHLTDWLNGSGSDGRCPACKAPCTMAEDTQSLSPRSLTSPSPKPPSPRVRYSHRDDSSPESYGGLVLSPSPVKLNPAQSILFMDSAEPMIMDPTQAPASPISSGSTSLASSSQRSASRSPLQTFTSMRQRRSSSHLFDDIYELDEETIRQPSPTPSDSGLYAPAVSLFVSRGTFVLISRTIGRVLSLVGLLIVLYVVLS